MTQTEPCILAIETSTSACSVALKQGDTLFSRFEVGSNVHSRVLLAMVDSVLSEASLRENQLDAIAVGQGPGSFTGLRIGVGVGQGLAFGADCPMIAVPSLDALAFSQQQRTTHVLAAIDARMGEVYWAEYELNGTELRRKGEFRVSPPEEVATDESKLILVGNAWAEYQSRWSAELLQCGEVDAENAYPTATNVVALAEKKYAEGEYFEAVEYAPLYVRDDVAKKSSKPLPGKRPGKDPIT